MKQILHILALPFIWFGMLVHFVRIAVWWLFTAILLYLVVVNIIYLIAR